MSTGLKTEPLYKTDVEYEYFWFRETNRI